MPTGETGRSLDTLPSGRHTACMPPSLGPPHASQRMRERLKAHAGPAPLAGGQMEGAAGGLRPPLPRAPDHL